MSKTIRVGQTNRAQLNWLVAKALGLTLHKDGMLNGVLMPGWHVSGHVTDANQWIRLDQLDYCMDWSLGGAILDDYIDCIRKRSKAEEASLAHPNPAFKFKAEIFGDIDGYFCGFGHTPLVAAARCFVDFKLGCLVEVPDDLSGEAYRPADRPRG